MLSLSTGGTDVGDDPRARARLVLGAQSVGASVRGALYRRGVFS